MKRGDGPNCFRMSAHWWIGAVVLRKKLLMDEEFSAFSGL